jgi:hypothetical protein
MRRLVAGDLPIVEPVTQVIRPSLAATIQPRGIAISATALSVSPPAAASRTQIWNLVPEARHKLNLSGTNQRIILLSATGAVLADTDTNASKKELPAGVESLILTEASDHRETGWDLMTQLVQAGPATFIGPAVVILAPEPWSARQAARHINKVSQTFPASQLTRAIDSLMTRFAIAADTVPRAVVVRLDRLDPAATPDSVVVKITGAATGLKNTVAHKNRVELIIPIEIEAGVESVSVKVETGAGWQLAGVIATQEQANDITDRLASQPFTRFTPKFRPTTEATQLELEVVT